MKNIVRSITFLFVIVINCTVYGQAPTISYPTPKTYPAGTTITPLTPTNTGVAAPGYSGTPVSLGSGFSQPAGVAVDAAGNIYVASYGNNLVEKIPVGGGTPVAVGSGFYHPNDVKVDAAGNVYVADQGNNLVKEIPAGGGSIITLGSGFSQPAAIAVDKAGNVYVADPGNGAVKKIPVTGGAPVILGYFNNPFGVAVDGQGIVYVSDATFALYEIPPGGGPSITLLSGLNNPNGIWADNSGNIFITDSSNGLVKMLPAGGGALVTIPFTFNFPFEVTTDQAGNIYVGDPTLTYIQKISVTGGYFINPSLPQGLLFNNTTGAISGTPTATSPATNYTVIAWNGSGSASATVNIKINLPGAPSLSYTTPQTYISGSANTPLSPKKTGVAALGYSNSPLVLGSGFNGPEGVAVDASGNVYVADAVNNELKKIPAGNGAPIVIASGFNLITDVAVDKSGNLYVTDYFNNEIKEFVGGTGTAVILGSGFNHPYGVAVDAAGNVYVGDQGNNAVKKIPAGNGAVVTLATGLYIPDDLCVDAAGNVYFADLGNNAIKKIPVGGGAPIIVGSGFTQPLAVAVDAAGNLFVTDRNNNAIKEIYAGTNTTVTISAGFNFPFGICVDGRGDVFVGDYGNNAVKEIKPVGGYFINALPRGLSFSESTGVLSGTPAVVSPATNYTVTAYNIGASKQATVSIGVIAPSPASALSGMTLSNGTLSPAFAAGTASYAASVTNGTTSIKVTPTVATSTSTVAVNGKVVASGTASTAIPLLVGANTITILVTASGGTPTTTYTLVVTRQLPNNDNLSALTLSSGTLSPAFTAAAITYKATVSNATSSITVTPTIAVTGETVTVNGTAVTSGTASGAIVLNYGANNTITVTVTAQDGVTIKSYTIAVTRTASSNANLSSLTIATGSLKPVFAAGTTGYSVSVSNGIASTTVTPTTADPTATVTVNGSAVTSGSASQTLPLVVGPNIIAIVVTAQDATTKTYTVTVSRAPSSNANLSSIGSSVALTPGFSSGTTSYTASVSNATASMTVKPVTSDANATLKINGAATTSGTVSGPLALAEGVQTVISIAVTAQDGTTTKTYTLTVTRAPSTNPGLTSLKPGTGTFAPTFSSGTTSYTESVSNSVSTMTVTPTTTDANATIKVNGTLVTSGSASTAIALAEGANTVISTVVTAQDGTTTKTYILTVTRAPSSNANLVGIGANVPITPGFSSGNTSYTASVSNATATMTVKPVTSDANAKIKVNGTATTSGTVFGPIALTAGAQTAISIAVTAQDGTTTKTYTLTVTRAAGGADSYDPGISVTKPTETPALAEDGIQVHQGISPNGDGINDFLQIDNISQYPDNKLMIMNRNGQLIYQATGYDNSSKVFDGHSNRNGQMQLPGTYFYQLDYTVNGIAKHKTGFIVLKY